MIRGVTAVSPIAIALFAGPNRLPPEAVSEADAEVQGITKFNFEYFKQFLIFLHIRHLYIVII